MWWTGSADDLNTTITRSFDLAAYSRTTLTVKSWYDIETGYDFLYLEYKTPSMSDFVQIGSPLTGDSNDKWTTLRYAIPGGSDDTLVRFRFQSDGGVSEPNAFLDNFVLKSGGTTIFTDNVETATDADWTPEGEGFKISTGTELSEGDRYFIAENRTYLSYDSGLQTGPYQFSFALTDPDKVEHFEFQDGLLVWMVDEAYTDNNNSEHTGRGLALPVDARPAPFFYINRRHRPVRRHQAEQPPAAVRRDVRDAGCSCGPQCRPEPADADSSDPLPCEGLHKQVIVGKGPNQQLPIGALGRTTTLEAIDTFLDDDVNAYWDSTNPQNSTKTTGFGVEIEVTDHNTNGPLTVNVTNPVHEDEE